jgi:hypothetical protein
MADRTQAALGKAIAETRGAIKAATSRLAVDHANDPNVAIDRFGERMIDFLTRAHSQAAYLGRYRAGDTSPKDGDDLAFAMRVVRGEDVFLARFEDALRAGRYTNEDGTLNTAAIQVRADLYLRRVRGTANETWALTTPGEIHWEIDTSAENCEDCLRHRAGSPYTWERLPTYPRAGETRCVTGCRCKLIAEGGGRSFR